jgi:hypothetical protein
MGLFRIQNSLQDKSLLARDRFVNTIYVTELTPPDPPVWANVAAAVKGFYTAIATYLSEHDESVTNTLKVYDMNDPPIRQPIYSEIYAQQGTTDQTSLGLPNEVALCLTFKANAQPLPIRPQSTRGRIFIGPLASKIMAGTLGGETRPNGTAMGVMVSAAIAMNQALVNAGALHVIASTKHHDWFSVMSYSCDDAFDTQRSRGNRPTTRALTAVPSAVQRVGTWSGVGTP